MSDLLSKLRKFDAYPKTLEDFRVRTTSGAAISIIAGLFISWLFVSELMLYLQTDVHHELFVDTTRGERLRINVDVTFPRMPCAYVSLDAMDISGEHQLDVAHNIFKKRLNSRGLPIGVEREEQLGGKPAVVVDESQLDQNVLRTIKAGCGSCYGSETEPGQCCNTCEQVRDSYQKKGWAFTNPDSIAQCALEGWSKSFEDQKNEGCQIYGHLLVNKVQGNFHFAPGKSFQQHHMHVHDLQVFKNIGGFNISHTINKLSFGNDYPGIINPLDNVVKLQDKEGFSVYQYFVKIVPTLYEYLSGDVVSTNQYSVTEHMREMPDPNKQQQQQQGGHNHGAGGGAGGHGLPGVFVMYDLSPIMVKFTERQKSFAHFMTGVCAIIGGVFTVAGLLDSFIYHGMRSMKKKMELGKAM